MRSIFTKWLALFILVVFLGFTGLTLGLMAFIENAFYENNLEDMAAFADTFQQVVEGYTGILTPSQWFLSDELTKLERYSGASVWLIATNGDIYVNLQEDSLNLLRDEIDFEEVQRVFSGETLVREARYATLDDQEYLTMIRPIAYHGETLYALYLNRAISGLNASMQGTKTMALAAVGFSTLLLGLTTFLMTRSIRRTLKRFNDAICYVARGNYAYTLDESRNDEFGDLAREFNAMSAELKNMDGMRRKFISEISHDLRSPLTSIKGFTKGMLDGTLPRDEHPRYLEIVMKEAERLSTLTEDILDLSRMQSGDAPLDRTALDINTMIRDTLETFGTRIDEKSLQPTLILTAGNPLVSGDHAQIARVLSNLLDNAIKFADPSGALRVETRETPQKILISVHNSGPEIPKDKLPSIWMRFSKLDDSRGAHKMSSGLGLAIVKEIIERHGETIDVQSEPGEGVTFAFTMRKFKEM